MRLRNPGHGGSLFPDRYWADTLCILKQHGTSSDKCDSHDSNTTLLLSTRPLIDRRKLHKFSLFLKVRLRSDDIWTMYREIVEIQISLSILTYSIYNMTFLHRLKASRSAESTLDLTRELVGACIGGWKAAARDSGLSRMVLVHCKQ